MSTSVAAIDLQHSRRRSAAVFGPVVVPDHQTAIARLRAMVDAGPALRLCLQPSTTSRRWPRVEADIGESVITASGADDDPLTLLDALRELPESGLRVALVGDRVAIDFSHGLGDIAFCQAVADVLVGGVPLDDPHWNRYRQRMSPLLVAATSTFASNPRRLAQLVGLHRRRPRPENLDQGRATANSAAPEPVTPEIRRSPTARWVRIPPDEVGRLRALRDRHRPGIGMFAIYTTALITAFDAAGLDLNPAVTIPVDVRPYLGGRIDTLAPFSAGLAFPLDVDSTPEVTQALLTESARSGRPVANLLVSTAKIRLASRTRPIDHGSAPSADSPADLLHSFVGRLPQTDSVVFTDPSEAFNHTISDPISPCGITVTSAVVGAGALCMTATFHADHVDAVKVEHALTWMDETIKQTIQTLG